MRITAEGFIPFLRAVLTDSPARRRAGSGAERGESAPNDTAQVLRLLQESMFSAKPCAFSFFRLLGHKSVANQ